jgi:CBS domain-containing protein
MAEILFLTELIGLRVFDLKGRALGRVKDAALVPLIDRFRVDRYLIGAGWGWLTVRHDQVERISLGEGIRLRDEKLTPYHNDEYMLRLVRDLLDQQIIDSHGRKVVRVTDVTFDIARGHEGNSELRVMEVDVGLRSILRRLAQGVLPPRWIRRVQQPIAPKSIGWQFCNIVEPDPQRRLRLNISNEYLEKMHPADIADIVEDLGPEDREAILSSIDPEVAADTLSEVEPEMQANILESLEAETAADILEEMAPEEAADVIAELETDTAGEILDEMEPESKTEVSEILEFREGTAGRLMHTEFVALPENATVGDAIRALREREDEMEGMSAIYLTDGRDRLIATVPLSRLFLAGSDAPLNKLAAETLVQVDIAERQNRVVELFDKYNLLALPVVDDLGRLTGVITADDVIALLRG